MSPALQSLCRNCQATLKHNGGTEGLQEVRRHLETALRDGAIIDEYLGPGAAPGLHLLYTDPELGFQVIAHVNAKGKTSPPHDHGTSWAIYGQAVAYTDMTDWERDGAEGVRRGHTTRLNPGDVGVFPPGAVHSISFPAASSYVRITGTNLDTIPRTMFDPETGTARRTPAVQSGSSAQS
ncbi:MAG: hypothetical protein AB7F71_18105 [Burkholderiaceae bacterium]